MAYFHQVVSLTGSDSNDGLSWSSPKATIAAAVTALPNGGDIYLGPTSLSADSLTRSAHVVSSTITLNGHRIIGMGNTRGPGGGSAPTYRQVEITHGYNGNLFNVVSGSLIGLTLYNTGAFTGAAIYNVAAGNPPTNQNSGYIYIDKCNVTGSTGWERVINIDASASTSPAGVRSMFVRDSTFFGATTAQETIVITSAVHVFFDHCEVIQAPAVAQQGIKILGSVSEDVAFTNCILHGDFYTDAGGTGGGLTGGVTWVGGGIAGTITCSALSARCRFAPGEYTTFTNLGAVTNAAKRLAA